MTKKEAEETIKSVEGIENDWKRFTVIASEIKYRHAIGFLEGLNSPEALDRKEVRDLVEALKDISDHSGIPNNFQGEKWSNYCHIVAFEALSNYKKAIGEENIETKDGV